MDLGDNISGSTYNAVADRNILDGMAFRPLNSSSANLFVLIGSIASDATGRYLLNSNIIHHQLKTRSRPQKYGMNGSRAVLIILILVVLISMFAIVLETIGMPLGEPGKMEYFGVVSGQGEIRTRETFYEMLRQWSGTLISIEIFLILTPIVSLRTLLFKTDLRAERESVHPSSDSEISQPKGNAN